MQKSEQPRVLSALKWLADKCLKVFLKLPQTVPDAAPVEIAVSPIESLIMKRGPFERMLGEFMDRKPQDLMGRPYQGKLTLRVA